MIEHHRGVLTTARTEEPTGKKTRTTLHWQAESSLLRPRHNHHADDAQQLTQGAKGAERQRGLQGVNGQVEVPAGGQLKVPALRGLISWVGVYLLGLGL